jgi:carbamoyl-phosphate synthase large subunit
MDKKRVLVTGIGGNVGQGIIRNIIRTDYNIAIIGTNTSAFSAGNHLCHKFYQVPIAYDEGYIPAMQEIVKREKIDLVIPSTDYEVYYLSINAGAIDAPIAASGPMAAETYLDKYLSYHHHQRAGIPFAASVLPSVYKGEFPQFILKPRKGRGSRGILINPVSWAGFSDDEYMIQEYKTGQEITTAFYVNRKGQLHGFITLLRSLENGATAQCKVAFDYDEALRVILEKMIRHTDFRGAANLQAIVTASGEIVPFEINCRISGTNSIRSNFGFEDVKYTLQEYLLGLAPDVPEIIPGVAVRILMDVIYQGKSDYKECMDNASGHYIY